MWNKCFSRLLKNCHIPSGCSKSSRPMLRMGARRRRGARNEAYLAGTPQCRAGAPTRSVGRTTQQMDFFNSLLILSFRHMVCDSGKRRPFNIKPEDLKVFFCLFYPLSGKGGRILNPAVFFYYSKDA